MLYSDITFLFYTRAELKTLKLMKIQEIDTVRVEALWLVDF